jgi:hypothetical protein
MNSSKLGLVFASVAALSIGVIGGKMILSKSGTSTAAPAVKASVLVTTSAPSADEPLRTAAPPPAGSPIASKPAPAASPPPAQVAAAPAPKAPAPAPSSTPSTDPDDDIGIKPDIRFNPDEGEVSIEAGGGGFTIKKDKIAVKTPFGDFDLDW